MLPSELLLGDFYEVESQAIQGPLSGKKELQSAGNMFV